MICLSILRFTSLSLILDRHCHVTSRVDMKVECLLLFEGLQKLISFCFNNELIRCTFVSFEQFHQYQVVGRALPTEKDEHPKIYRMKLWATNEVRAKSKFW